MRSVSSPRALSRGLVVSRITEIDEDAVARAARRTICETEGDLIDAEVEGMTLRRAQLELEVERTRRGLPAR
jgi:hypothetical protein